MSRSLICNFFTVVSRDSAKSKQASSLHSLFKTWKNVCKCTGFILILTRFKGLKTTKYAFFDPVLQVLVYQYN